MKKTKDLWLGYNSELGLFHIELDESLLVKFFKMWMKKQSMDEKSMKHYLRLAKKSGEGYIIFRNPEQEGGDKE